MEFIVRSHGAQSKQEGGAEFAGPENDEQKKIKDWKMQDLENGGPNRRAGKCRTWKMTDQIAGLENAGPGK